MKFYNLGTNVDSQEPLGLTEQELSLGTVVLGVPGSGKSSLLRQLGREHRRNRRSMLVVDSSDTADDFLADGAKELITTDDPKRVLPRTHLLALDPYQMARCDLFEPTDLSHIHVEAREISVQALLTTKVHAVAQTMLRAKGQTQFDVQVRLERVLTNVFMGVGTLVKGQHLPLGAAQALVDVYHPRHFVEYESRRPFLPSHVVGDFEMLHSMKRPQDVRTESESSLNLLRKLGPLLRNAFSGTGKEPAFSMRKATERGDTVIVSVKQTPFVSHEENMFFASILIQQWVHALLNCPREKRRGSTLLLDEAHEYLRVLPDLPRFQRILRKYGGGIVYATQDRASLRTKDLDIAPEVLGLSNNVFAYRQTWPEDVDLVARLLYAKNIDYTKLYHDIYQHQGEYDWLQIRETSRQIGFQEQWTETIGEGEDESEQIQESRSRADQSTWGKAKAKSLGTGATHMNGWANGVQASSGQSDSPVIVDGALKNTLRIANQSGSINKTENGADTTSAQESDTETESEGGGTTQSQGVTIGSGRSKKKMRTKGKSGGTSTGTSESDKLLPLPKLVHLQQDTGQLKEGTPDLQYERFGSELSSLPQREAVVRIRGGKAMKFVTAEVREPFTSVTAQMKAVEWFKRRLYETHDYFFTPSVEEVSSKGYDADEPVIVGETEDEEEYEEESPLA